MFPSIGQFFFLSLIATALAQSNGIVHTSISSIPTPSESGYPPSGLLDSLSSMKAREEVYQNELSQHAARQLVVDPAFSPLNTNPIPTGVLASIRSIESVYRSLLLPGGDGERSTNSLGRTGTPSYRIPQVTSAIPTTIGLVLPKSPPEMTNFTTPQTSDAPQPHVLISIVWVLVMAFIIGITLYTALNGFGTFIILFLALNVICAVIVGAQAHPHPHPHAHVEPRGRPIGGLRPGPVGKIPCGEVRGMIGTKHGHFVEGAHRKIGGLRPEIGELMCDDWSNAFIPRGVAIPTQPDDDTEPTTTICTTTDTTVWVTVEDTETETRTVSPCTTNPAAFITPNSASTTQTVSTEPTPSLLSLSRPEEFQSSAVPPVINIRTSASSLFLLYVFGIFLCLLAGGSPGALSYVVISLAIAAIMAGAEAAVVAPHAGLHYAVGWKVGGVRPEGAGRDRESSEVAVWNGAHTITGSVEGARGEKLCGEVFCHDWVNAEITPAIASTESTLTYGELAKRLSTVYVTVEPTSGTIGIFGPQIIPITVVSTAFENVVPTTVDILTVRSTRTKVVPAETPEQAPGYTQVKPSSKSQLDMARPTTVTMRETTTISPSPPPNTSNEVEKLEPSTIFITTTFTLLPSSTTPAIPSSSLLSSFSPFSPSPPTPSILPLVSSAPYLDPSNLYLSFVETNLYCFLFLFLGLQLALTTMGHPGYFLEAWRF